ncbi:hypothetical protein GALMADRAFT_237043 [Galerina marginata CBS 339.88]|uniref:Uncharacterized protein n=1 Tax=Galerina marginata (strain CBS 339.88) TaxID=685588 RepID=A0A067TWE3_GALM3|nr:hypothetical protein GALMADRAFT_237043 [Galerina marginata CBS 339.88]
MSRPRTPESPLTNSLYHATSTIDDLTAALANFSRVPSPEPVASLSCCCGKDDCENLKAWLDLKSRLGSRLVLSAEVGQALLQRHAAYVRQNERKMRNDDDPFLENKEPTNPQTTDEDLHREIEELAKEKAQLEKRLNQALVNNEVTEVSNKTILQELHEARETISRLTAHHARSVGWDTRLSAALKERDDMQQERDGETHRARLAESRFAALKEKTAKLQAEVRRLQDSLEEKRHSRLEFSETVIQDARSRLDSFRNSQLGLTAKVEEDELTTVLESLVQDNEILKHDNAELQHLLAEAREDVHALQEEVDEQRAAAPPPRSGANTPLRHFHTGSVPSITMKDFKMSKGRNASAEGRSRRRSGPLSIDLHMNTLTVPHREPLTPDTARSPVSFAESLNHSEAKWNAFGHLSPRSSHVSYEVEEDADKTGDPTELERSRGHKPLLLLTRSRGMQTDFFPPGGVSPSPLPSQFSSISPHEHHSETSSFSESQSSHLSVILERASNLLNRLTQADALTLTNRLKRQHLKGADVAHVSRSTVSNIVAEAIALRAQFRGLLEDEKVVTTCTRKDLRVLFKFVKDMFTEMGHIRVTLNDVVLDPSTAHRVSELALNPGRAEAEKREKEENSLGGGVAGWMAPISKLFSPTGRVELPPIEPGGLTRTTSAGGKERTRPPRFAPKLGPALAASATTVNVEFSGTGVGRAVSSTLSAQPMPVSNSSMDASVTPQGSSSLMGIFAGAPRAIEPDPWVVLPAPPPQPLRKKQSFVKPPESQSQMPAAGTATIGRANGRRNSNRLSRNVDAVIDVERPQDIDEEPDFLPPLLQRTLRRRGLSDSSIHSTFTSQGDDPMSPTLPPSPQRPVFAGPSSRLPAWPDRSSMFQVLSRTVQNLRASSGAGGGVLTPPFSPPREPATGAVDSRQPRSKSRTREQASSSASPAGAGHTPASDTPTPSTPKKVTPSNSKPARIASPNRGTILPNFSSWAVAEGMFDPSTDPVIASSMRDESYMQRIPRGRTDNSESHARDFY